MDAKVQIVMLEYRAKNLIASEKNNDGAQQKIRRQIRKLKAQIAEEAEADQAQAQIQ